MRGYKLLILVTVMIAPLVSAPVITASAQVLTKEGTVFNWDGTTMDGWIEYRDWKFTPASIRFKRKATSKESVVYTAKDIRGFSISEYEIYVSVRIRRDAIPHVDNSIDSIGYFDLLKDKASTKDTIFFKLISKGDRFNLYSCQENEYDQEHLYLQLAGEVEAKELVYCSCDDNRHKRTEEHNKYKQVLKEMMCMSGCTNEELASADQVKVKNLPDFVNDLNRDHVNIMAVKKYSTKLNWFVRVGKGFSFYLEPYPGVSLYDYHFRTGKGHFESISVGADFLRPHLFHSLAIQGEMSFENHTLNNYRFYSLYPSISILHERLYGQRVRWSTGVSIGMGVGFYPDSVNTLVKISLKDPRKYWGSCDFISKMTYEQVELGIRVPLINSNTFYVSMFEPRQVSFFLGYHFKKHH